MPVLKRSERERGVREVRIGEDRETEKERVSSERGEEREQREEEREGTSCTLIQTLCNSLR